MHDTFTLNSDITTSFFYSRQNEEPERYQSSGDLNGTRAHISTPQQTALYDRAVGVHNSIA